METYVRNRCYRVVKNNFQSSFDIILSFCCLANFIYIFALLFLLDIFVCELIDSINGACKEYQVYQIRILISRG